MNFVFFILFVFSTISGNIRVFCRCRPLSKDEVSSGQKCVVDFDGSSDGDIVITNGGTKKTFKFDRVFTPKDDQGILVITLMFE
jgi:kinesin family member C2/C3